MITHIPYVEVTARDGEIYVKAKRHWLHKSKVMREVEEIVKTFPEVQKIKVDVSPHVFNSF